MQRFEGDKHMTWQLDATALSALLDTREITPLQLLEQSLGRLNALEPVLNAFTHVDRDGALAAAKAATARQAAGVRLGPLDGIPVSVKDNIFVAGLPARWGSLLFREHIPDRDDICVERLRVAGAVIIGKTTTPELAMLGRTDSRLSGVTRSPWDPALTPGGSSGGASASVAAGITTLAIGTDMGGSTRLPASYTSLLGMRPSTGRIPRRYGFPATAIDFQVIGPFARTMRDMRLLYGTLVGPDTRDPYSGTVSAARISRATGGFGSAGSPRSVMKAQRRRSRPPSPLPLAPWPVRIATPPRYPPPSTLALCAAFMLC